MSENIFHVAIAIWISTNHFTVTTVMGDRKSISLNMLGNPKQRKGKRKETLPRGKNMLEENATDELRRETACPSIHEKDINEA